MEPRPEVWAERGSSKSFDSSKTHDSSRGRTIHSPARRRSPGRCRRSWAAWGAWHPLSQPTVAADPGVPTIDDATDEELAIVVIASYRQGGEVTTDYRLSEHLA